jgi:hypothetical protein
MIIDQGQSVTETVLAVMPTTPDERLGAATSAMVRHLHAVIRETKPMQQEVECGLDFLVGLGRATPDRHDEVGPSTDVIGVSTPVAWIFADDDSCLDSDLVFGVTTALNGRSWPANDPGIAACRLEQDLILKAGHALLSKSPIA